MQNRTHAYKTPLALLASYVMQNPRAGQARMQDPTPAVYDRSGPARPFTPFIRRSMPFGYLGTQERKIRADNPAVYEVKPFMCQAKAMGHPSLQPENPIQAPGHPRKFRSYEAQGFTLIEMIIAIVIVAILLAIGVPGLRDLISMTNVRGAANDLYTDLTYARSEAIKRNVQVSVVQGTGGWTDGWSVQVGGNSLRTQGRLSNVSLATPASPDTLPTSVVFNADGRTTLGTAGNASFNFSSALGGVVSMRCVVVTASGRPAVLVDGNRNGNCKDG